MDKNVELLLREEAEVNRKVQAAIAKKNEQLKSIKREAEIAMKDWRKEKELEFERKLQKVSGRCLLTLPRSKKILRKTRRALLRASTSRLCKKSTPKTRRPSSTCSSPTA